MAPGAALGVMGTPGRPSNARLAELNATIARQERTIAALSGRIKAAKSKTEKYWEPACMEADDWTDWQAFNRTAGSTMRAQRPCDDCPMSFALEMFAARRCNGVPALDE